MPRKVLVPVLLVAAVVIGSVWYLRSEHGPRHYTGFVEGEERVLRSEVAGRIEEVHFAEGDRVPAGAVIAVVSDDGIAAKIQSKQEEIAAIESEVRAQTEQVTLVSAVWERDVSARRAELEQTASAADLARRTFEREQKLVKSGASTVQQLDDSRSRRDQAQSMWQRAKEMVARAEAEETQISLARTRLQGLESKLGLARAQLNELRVEQGKFEIRSPAVETIVQTQFLWPGELAQPGSAVLAVIDPEDKYVQIYVPVADVAQVRPGTKAEIELDSQPGRRTPGEVSFVADRATFTPDKIETRDDRMGQVYRVKVRILEGVEQFQPGTEGNVYLSPAE